MAHDKPQTSKWKWLNHKLSLLTKKMSKGEINYPFPHLMLGLSDKNMGRKCMKSSPTGLSFPLGVIGRQDTQEELTTLKQHKE